MEKSFSQLGIIGNGVKLAIRLVPLSAVFFLLTALPASTFAQPPACHVIDTIPCLSEPSQSYALYLPSYYDTSRNWPVLFIFEPAARGALPVDSFRMAAEKYGYLLAASNVSRNGPTENNFAAAAILMTDVQQRFQIDTNRVYFSGFSGGSRVALAMGSRYPSTAGVIGCGAALPNLEIWYPTSQSPFSYVGLVGLRDLNYREMLDLKKQLDTLDVSNHLLLFDAGHQWPTPALLMEAVEWLELEAQKKDWIPQDSLFLDNQLAKRLEQIQQSLADEQWTEAARQYRLVLSHFSELLDVEPYRQELKELEHSKDYQKAQKQAEKLAGIEAQWDRQLHQSAERLSYPVFATDSLRQWWRQEIKTLKKTEQKKNIAESQMAARLLSWITVASVEWGRQRMEAQEYRSALDLLELGVLVDSDNYYFHFQLAKAQSLTREFSDAIKSLEKAEQLGFHQKIWLEDPAFDPIRQTEGFVELLRRLL